MEPIITSQLVRFTRQLRGRGLSVTPNTAADMAASLEFVDLSLPADVQAALAGLVARSPDQRRVFDEEYLRFFGAPPSHTPIDEEAEGETAEPGEIESWSLRSPAAAQPDETEAEVADRVGASAFEKMALRDFAGLDESEMEEARRLVAAMMWSPARTKSRRWQPDHGGRRPDMRATMRRMVGARAGLIPLEMADRRKRQRPMVLIADVSGSMEAYAEMMLAFGHAARARLGRVESFVFSTSLTRITWELSRRNVRQALDGVADVVDDWSGGTKIGAALASFNRDWSRRVCRGGPLVLIVSDGWDCGDPALLDREMARLARSVHRVVWLNPLAGRDGYAPETRGMQTVLPYVDDFLPAANLTDLAGVIELLESSTRRELVRR